MFVACAEEELVKVENSSQQTMEEVVGANLVGTGISINAYMGNSDSQTRYADGNNGWGEGDVVGLGWLIGEGLSVGDAQSPSKKPGGSVLYANHMFDTEDSGNTWSTKGNVYEGWYYAYYPWAYMKKAGSQNFYVLNPDMKGAGVPLHQSQSLYMSNNQFISEADLDHETNTVDKSFKMHQAVKFIQVTATPQAGSPFEKGEKLSHLDITSIKISADQNVFTTKAVLYGKSLPVNVDYPENATAEQKKEVDIQNLKNFRAAYSSVVVSSEKSNSIERNVAKAGVKVSTNDGNQKNVNFYMNVLPAKLALAKENITIEVTTSASKFVIKYANTPSATNKKAIEDFVAAFAKDGSLSTILDVDAEGNPANLKNLKLAIELCGEDYTTDFSAIDSYEKWAAAVNEVEVLGLQNEEFTITGDIEFTDNVLMPTNDGFTKLTVTTPADAAKKIVLKGEHTGLPANLDVQAVDVVVEGTLLEAHTITPKSITNNGIIEVSAGSVKLNENTGKYEVFTNTVSNVINNGTIKLGEYAEVEKVTNNKRIEVVYGSFVTELSGDGQIAYMVKPEDKQDPNRVQRVINESNQEGAAQVNTLVFNALNDDKTANISEFDFTYVSEANAGKYDPYLGTTGNSNAEPLVWDGLEEVSLEIDGVNVYSSKKDQTITVDNVTLANADLGQNISVDGNLTITEGDVKVITNGSIGKDLIIENGSVEVNVADIVGALNITTGNGTITSADGIGSVTIAAGNYTVNAETIEGAVVATGENYFNVSVFNGAVTMTNTSSSNVIAIDGAAFESNVTLTGTYGLVNTTVKGDLTINGGTENAPVKLLNVEVKGNLTVKGGYVVANNVNVTGDLTVEAGTYVNNAEGDTNIANIVVKSGATLNANNDVYVQTIAVYGTVKVATGKTIWYTVPTKEGGYIQEGTTTGRVKSTNEYAETVAYNLENGKDVTLETDIELTEGLAISKDVTLDLNGKTLKNVATDNGWITSNAKLTIKNGSMSFDGTAVYAQSGELNLIDCDIIQTGTTGGDGVYVSKDATVVISECSIEATGENVDPDDVCYGIGVVGGNVTVKNSTVKGFHGGITAHSNSVLNIDGGKFIGTVWHGLNIQETGVTVALSNKPEFDGKAGDVQVYLTTATINGVTFDAGIYTQEEVYEKL